MRVYMYLCMFVYMYLCMCVYMYLCMCVYMYIYVCVCVYICMCMYVCMCLYVYVNEWFYNILRAIFYSRIPRILRMSNLKNITHGSIYGDKLRLFQHYIRKRERCIEVVDYFTRVD